MQSVRRRSARHARQEGFTLIEAMIALGILALGMAAVAVALVTGLKHAGQSRALTQALYLAQQQIEAVQAMTAADVLALRDAATYPNDPTNPIDPDPGDQDVVTYNRRWLVDPDTPEAGVMRVTVQVDWQDARGTVRTVSLQTLKAGS
jgi:prepilin-type N-terminal cleavage/methylation domain-containing protein